jgi:hypothetical protein
LRAQSGEKRAAAIGCVAAFLLSNIHTYDALPLGTTLLLWAIFNAAKNKKAAFAPLIIACGAVPPLIYQFYVFKNSTEFQLKAITVTAPPPLPDVLLSYTPLLLFAFYGAWLLRKNESARLLMLWAIVTLILIYAPVSFGRKMIEGFHLPLCFFAATATIAMAKSRPVAMQRLFALGCGAILCISSLQLITWALADAPKSIQPYRGAMPPLYLTQSDAAALQFLRNQHDNVAQGKEKPAAVLSLNFVGNYLPAKTGYHAYLGHWAETLNFDQKSGEVAALYEGKIRRDEALNWLRKNHIRYVFFGFYEHAVFQSPQALNDLLGSPIYTAPSTGNVADSLPPTSIYAVPTVQ